MLSFEQASILDPTWTTATDTLEDLIKYLTSTQTLYQRKGQMKIKRLKQMTEVLLNNTLPIWYTLIIVVVAYLQFNEEKYYMITKTLTWMCTRYLY